MRLFVIAAFAAAVTAVPSIANADGGAYLNLDTTYYIAGDTAVATTYVSIPKSKADLLDRGPFYAFVVPDGVALREGTPIPQDAVRVGTFSVTHENGAYEFETRFTMPSLQPGWNALRLCNDPCTIAGFREPLYGSFYVVETQREATLLKENGTLRGQLAGARRDATKAERVLDGTKDDLRTAERDASGAYAEIEALRDQLATAEADAASARTRSLNDRRIALAVADLIALAVVVLLVRARKPRSKPRSDLEQRRGFVAAASRAVRR